MLSASAGAATTSFPCSDRLYVRPSPSPACQPSTSGRFASCTYIQSASTRSAQGARHVTRAKRANAASSEQLVSIEALEPGIGGTSCSSCSSSTCWIPAAACFGAGLLTATFILWRRQQKPAVKEELPDDPHVLSKTTQTARQHQRVLAKTRQATHVSNAVVQSKAGEITKALLELNRALVCNSICRCQAIVTNSKAELADLYRLHIQNTEQPPNFATLLQLQEMLGLSQDEAESIEREVLHSPAAFAI